MVRLPRNHWLSKLRFALSKMSKLFGLQSMQMTVLHAQQVEFGKTRDGQNVTTVTDASRTFHVSVTAQHALILLL